VHKHWGASTFTQHPQPLTHTHTTPSASLTHTEQVVNDVAEVNIDAKLLAKRQMAEEDEAYQDTVELENGCACCTAGPDLMDSILKLVRLSLRRDITYDRIVIEMSGVAGAHSQKYSLSSIYIVIRLGRATCQSRGTKLLLCIWNMLSHLILYHLSPRTNKVCHRAAELWR